MMKKSLLISLFILGFNFSGFTVFNSTADESIQPLILSEPANSGQKPVTASSTSVPLRICFLPEVWYWPAGLDVHGLNIGLPVAYGEKEKVYGLDFGLIASMTDGVKGLQTSLITKGYQAAGGEVSLINFAEEFTGFQAGILNSQTKSDSVQIGLINISNKSNGLQLGLINLMDNGFLPIFPILNFSM